ncbi:MAG: type II secretion system GspH family protein [Planctomycetota bacterium]|nr:type II secretion system GspH family protein [Planctomycetota bacterium]
MNALPRRKLRRGGYTIVEILVVLGIMAILMGIGMYGYTAVRKLIRIKVAKADLAKIKTAIEKYKQIYDKWPGKPRQIDVEDPPGSGKKIKVLVYDDEGSIYEDLTTKYSRGCMLAGLEKDKSIPDPENPDRRVLVDPWEMPYCIRIYRDVLEVYSFGPDKTSDLGRAEGDRRLPKLENLPPPAAPPYDDITP